MHTHFCSFGNVYFVGAEIGQGVVAGLCDCDKLLHLAIRDNDRDIFTVRRACVVLEKIDALLEILDCLFVGVHEYQIVYGRHQLALLCSVALFDEHCFHRDKTFNAFTLQKLLRNTLPAVGGAHSKPNNVVLFFHDAMGL